MRLVGPVQLCAHEETDEDFEDYVEDLMSIGVPKEDATQFITSNPLYEVTFDFYLDLDSGTAYCTKVDLGDGEPLERDCPGKQLELFGRKYA